MNNTTDTPLGGFEERLLAELREIVAERARLEPRKRTRHRPTILTVSLRRSTTRWATLAVAAVAVAAFVVIPLLGGSRTAIAQAEVLKRASAALDQPDRILYVQPQDYSADGDGVSMLGGNELGGFVMCVPGPCSHSGAPATAQTGISANPSSDTLTYSSQEWLGPGQDHTIYNNGDEVATSDATDQYVAYDATDNTLTTLTGMGFPSTPTSSPPSDLALAAAPGAIGSNLADPSFYEQLYQQVQAGQQATIPEGSAQTTVAAHLIGQTTIAGESVYELRFDVQTTMPSGGDLTGPNCGPTVCTLATSEILLYLDSQTYTPVRTVVITLNPNDNQGLPDGTAVSQVADYSVQSLPDTSANEALLQMSAHPGAAQVRATYAQYRAEHGLSPLTGSTASTGATGSSGTSGSSGATGSSNEAGPTGSSGASASGSSGVTGTAPTN